jgi:hypothetical protein
VAFANGGWSTQGHKFVAVSIFIKNISFNSLIYF